MEPTLPTNSHNISNEPSQKINQESSDNKSKISVVANGIMENHTNSKIGEKQIQATPLITHSDEPEDEFEDINVSSAVKSQNSNETLNAPSIEAADNFEDIEVSSAVKSENSNDTLSFSTNDLVNTETFSDKINLTNSNQNNIEDQILLLDEQEKIVDKSIQSKQSEEQLKQQFFETKEALQQENLSTIEAKDAETAVVKTNKKQAEESSFEVDVQRAEVEQKYQSVETNKLSLEAKKQSIETELSSVQAKADKIEQKLMQFGVTAEDLKNNPEKVKQKILNSNLSEEDKREALREYDQYIRYQARIGELKQALQQLIQASKEQKAPPVLNQTLFTPPLSDTKSKIDSSKSPISFQDSMARIFKETNQAMQQINLIKKGKEKERELNAEEKREIIKQKLDHYWEMKDLVMEEVLKNDILSYLHKNEAILSQIPHDLEPVEIIDRIYHVLSNKPGNPVDEEKILISKLGRFRQDLNMKKP